MTVKGQLHACRDSLMAGMRAASRGAAPNPKAEPLLRACLDLVEHLVRQSLDVTTAEVETTLACSSAPTPSWKARSRTRDQPSAAALKNAIGQLKALRLELGAK